MMDDMEQEAEYTAADLDRIGAKWIEKIRQAEKREEDWFKRAEKAEKAYLADEKDAPEFNILHSNVETIVPSIYNSAGTPDIRPRHNAKDELGKLVADILERSILSMIDDNRMDTEVEEAAQDAFVAGRGVVRIKFDADVTEQPAMAMGPMGPEPVIDPATGLPQMQQVVQNERVQYESVSFRDYREGPATRWENVPWVAFKHTLLHEEIEKLQDEAMAEAYGKTETDSESDEETDGCVWEIWCKDSRRVYFIVGDSNKVLKIVDDPLRLSGFFPLPAPVQPIKAVAKRMPVVPFEVYKTLADELDDLTKRIRGLTSVLQAKGVGIGEGTVYEDLAAAGDGEIVMAADMENILQAGGLDKAIMWWPIDRIIQVIRELNAQREQTKQAIYEITGISDIIRGQGAASETATAQQIKTQWGSLRIKKMQNLLSRLVRDLFVLTAEVMSLHFQPQTLQKLSGVQIPPEAMELLKKPLDHYRIDIESDSTVRADLVKGRQEMSEFLAGTAQFFSTMTPIASQAPAALGPIVEIYSAFARQFNLGKQAEDALDQLTQMAQELAKNPPPNPEAEAMKAEMAQRAKEADQKHDLEMQRLGLDVKLKGADLKLKQRELGLKEATAEVDAAAKLVEIEMEDDQQRAVAFGEG